MLPGPVLARVERLLEARVRRQSEATKGHTRSHCAVVVLDDGHTAFVKAAGDGMTAAWLERERSVYAGLAAAPFVPRMLGWDGHGPEPVLVLEDLSAFDWPPPWSGERVQMVRSTLDEVAATSAPADLPALADLAAATIGWHEVAADPDPFLSVGACTGAWLEAALPDLLAAADRVDWSGDALVHGDVRAANTCFGGGRTLLVDWSWACRGTPRFDLLSWLPSLQTEGVAVPSQTVDDEPELLAWIAGFWAAQAGLPADGGLHRLRVDQRRQLAVALPWAARALLLPPPLVHA